MYIELSVETEKKGEYQTRWFDAAAINVIAELDGKTTFMFFDLWYVVDGFAPVELVEAVMQCRMNPSEYLPSRYVGKDDKPEPTSTGSLRWQANAARKK